MASLVEHAMINKLGDDLDSAITFVGGDTSSVTNIMQYPEIIKQQLSSSGINLNSSIILEGDSCVILSDEDGRDYFNTEYASGIKTGLNPETYYVRICTAVKDIEPVYIDLTPITNLIGSGELPGDIDLDAIVKAVLKELDEDFAKESDLLKISSDVNGLKQKVEVLENAEPEVTEEDLLGVKNELGARIESIESIDITNNYVSKESLESMELVSTQDVADIVSQNVESNETIVNITQELNEKVDAEQVKIIVQEKIVELGNDQGLTDEEINDLGW